MSLGDRIIEALEEFAEQLESGERIVTTIIQRCPCNEAREKRGNPKCRECGGRGWLIDANTLWGK